jgi:hypothetical protein
VPRVPAAAAHSSPVASEGCQAKRTEGIDVGRRQAVDELGAQLLVPLEHEIFGQLAVDAGAGDERARPVESGGCSEDERAGERAA